MSENETPKYRVLNDSFFAPKMVLAGSVISTHAPPGPHLEPLNAAARARMEAWYEEEHPTLDKNGDPNFEKTFKPHAIHRITLSPETEQHSVTVLSEPKLATAEELSQAAALYTGARDTDQRPGPAQPRLPLEPEVPVDEAMAAQSGVKVEEENKTPSDPRKAGVTRS